MKKILIFTLHILSKNYCILCLGNTTVVVGDDGTPAKYVS